MADGSIRRVPTISRFFGIAIAAELHQQELADNWRRARAGETLQSIEPLR